MSHTYPSPPPSLSPPRRNGQIAEPPPAQQAPSMRVSYRREDSVSPGRRGRSVSTRRSTSTSRAHSRVRLLHPHREKDSPDSTDEKKLGTGQPRRDPRSQLPLIISRFLGYRPLDDRKPPHRPIVPAMLRIPARLEALVLAFLGCFVGILLAEAILIGSPLFTSVWGNTPLVIASLGAQSVLIYGLVESPLSQPRNVLGGQMISALVGIIYVKIFQTSPFYHETTTTEPSSFQSLVWVQAALAMATSYVAMDLTKTLHPPGGATTLIACTTLSVTDLHFRFLRASAPLELLTHRSRSLRDRHGNARLGVHRKSHCLAQLTRTGQQPRSSSLSDPVDLADRVFSPQARRERQAASSPRGRARSGRDGRTRSGSRRR